MMVMGANRISMDGTTHSEHCWSFGPKHYECALARIAQLEADLKVAQNYEDQHYERCQQLEAALAGMTTLFENTNRHAAKLEKGLVKLNNNREQLLEVADRLLAVPRKGVDHE